MRDRSATASWRLRLGGYLKRYANVDIRAIHAPYKTCFQTVPDVYSIQVDYSFDSILWSLPQIRAGKPKGLAIPSVTRSPLAPDLPTVAEAGLLCFEGITWFGLVAPAATPKDGQNNALLSISMLYSLATSMPPQIDGLGFMISQQQNFTYSAYDRALSKQPLRRV